nr:uncharacterized protein LOC121470965 [Taeniopygia guttata]
MRLELEHTELGGHSERAAVIHGAIITATHFQHPWRGGSTMCSKEMGLWVLPLGPLLAALCRWSWQLLGSAACRESEMAEGRQDSSSRAQAELCGRGQSWRHGGQRQRQGEEKRGSPGLAAVATLPNDPCPSQECFLLLPGVEGVMGASPARAGCVTCQLLWLTVLRLHLRVPQLSTAGLAFPSDLSAPGSEPARLKNCLTQRSAGRVRWDGSSLHDESRVTERSRDARLQFYCFSISPGAPGHNPELSQPGGLCRRRGEPVLGAGAAAGAVQGGWGGMTGVTPGFGVGEEKCGCGAPDWESAYGNCGGDGAAGSERRGGRGRGAACRERGGRVHGAGRRIGEGMRERNASRKGDGGGREGGRDARGLRMQGDILEEGGQDAPGREGGGRERWMRERSPENGGRGAGCPEGGTGWECELSRAVSLWAAMASPPSVSCLHPGCILLLIHIPAVDVKQG